MPSTPALPPRALCWTSCWRASAAPTRSSSDERGAVDFDDLELCAGELLDERESVRAAWSERFELLMVDEFQDTNPRQLAILRALDRGNLFTVGDEFQSIYGFRHADVSLFRARRAELAGRGGSLALTRNYRSRARCWMSSTPPSSSASAASPRWWPLARTSRGPSSRSRWSSCS